MGSEVGGVVGSE
jgi:hypothetical protein